MSKTYVYIVTTYTNPPTSSYPPPFTTKKCTLEPYEGSIADANARALSLLYDHYVKNRGHGSRYWEALEQEWKKKKVLVYRSKDGCLEMKDFPKDSDPTQPALRVRVKRRRLHSSRNGAARKLHDLKTTTTRTITLYEFGGLVRDGRYSPDKKYREVYLSKNRAILRFYEECKAEEVVDSRDFVIDDVRRAGWEKFEELNLTKDYFWDEVEVDKDGLPSYTYSDKIDSDDASCDSWGNRRAVSYDDSGMTEFWVRKRIVAVPLKVKNGKPVCLVKGSQSLSYIKDWDLTLESLGVLDATKPKSAQVEKVRSQKAGEKKGRKDSPIVLD